MIAVNISGCHVTVFVLNLRSRSLGDSLILILIIVTL
jgi:hypothetical protein